MMRICLIAIIVLLAIFGLSELLHSLWLLMIAPKRVRKTVSVVWLDPERAEQQLYFVAAQKGWLGGNFADHVVAVCSALGGEGRKMCESIAGRHGIVLCPEKELVQTLQDLSHE